ncbi:Matrix metalloproteinase-17 [Holothuria leucospilota]|uniref:Matrix metalloproteinase-17 n=1 Tax=Holothuria leucospilota TaxID=206669 RepID=A0A9Q1CI54_HOLLE|nr:Matrix metalloproteinase-17 [Holothuria leucospilota]
MAGWPRLCHTVLLLSTVSLASTNECPSGKFDAITRTSDGGTYAFRGGLVMKLTSCGTSIARGFPQPICSVFPGLESDLDAALYWENTGKTYFFKGDKYYRFSGTTMDAGYPKSISLWRGLPSNIDAAVVWAPNGKTYFFKGDQYYRYNRADDRVDDGYPAPLTQWIGMHESVDATLQWSNSVTYLFSGELYYRYDDDQNSVHSDYPLSTTANWLGCDYSSLDEIPTDVCFFDTTTTTNVACLSGDFDAITRIHGGDTYGFKGSMVVKLTEAGSAVVRGFPQTICSVFPGLPSNLDAAVFWEDTGKTYFFKGDKYYRTSGVSLDSGYPRPISKYWEGLPSNIDAAVVWSGDGRTYFFKGDQYYRYNRETQRIDDGYPAPSNEWRGIPSPVDSAIRWSNDKTYLFVGEDYYRYNDESNVADSGYPALTSTNWLGCESSETAKSTCWAREC